MSITKRLISGSAASWSQIGVTVLSQVLLVPIYLSFWSVKTYGIWLAIQAFVSILSTLDLGHQAYLGFEFLRIGQQKRDETAAYLWSGIWIAVILGTIELLIISGLVFTGLFKSMIVETGAIAPELIKEAGMVLIIQGLAWLFTGSAGGIFVRALNAFNYYPRLAWWGVFNTAITAIAPAIAITFGASFLTTGIVSAGATLFFNVFLYTDMFRLLRKVQIPFTKGSLSVGWVNFIQSLALSLRNLLENMRVTGVRVILSPVAGPQLLGSFSTIRTGANFAMQGLHSITHPMLPELMKFLNERDQQRVETAFGTIWIVIVALMAPGILLLQVCIAPFFNLWTRGKIPFDAPLFALLSIGVLVYALAQPAIAIVTGNNLLRIQLRISAIAAGVVVAGVLILVPMIGIRGAGIALLVAELTATMGYNVAARKWLAENSLSWPERASALAARSVWIAAAALGAILLFPQLKWWLLVLVMVLLGINLIKYWSVLPGFARERAVMLLKKFKPHNRQKNATI